MSCNVTTPCPSDCSGNGKCDRGRCLCNIGYEGWILTKSTCPNDCSVHVFALWEAPASASQATRERPCEYSPGCGDKICEYAATACACARTASRVTRAQDLSLVLSGSRPNAQTMQMVLYAEGMACARRGERVPVRDGWSGDTCLRLKCPATFARRIVGGRASGGSGTHAVACRHANWIRSRTR